MGDFLLNSQMTDRFLPVYIHEGSARCLEKSLSADIYLYKSITGSSAKELPFYAEHEDVGDDNVHNLTIGYLLQ